MTPGHPPCTLVTERGLKLSGLHILLTYRCTCECDHCFVWGGPQQRGVFTLENISRVLEQARDAGVEWIYFEGGEPFLYYPVLVSGVHQAAKMGFSVGIVSNAYWAETVADAAEWLQPFAGRVSDLTVSSDLYHCETELGEQPQNAIAAAKFLGIPTGMISVAQLDECAASSHGQLEGKGEVMFRGRAAVVLAPRASVQPWESFDECPHEDLREPGRVHLDPFGNVHICQGLTLGNVFTTTLKDICRNYDPDQHPICGPLLEGGPAALVTEYGLTPRSGYADACHLCYESRLALRTRFPDILSPDEMYGPDS